MTAPPTASHPKGRPAMPLLDAYLVQAHQQDLLRAAASTRRLDRSARPAGTAQAISAHAQPQAGHGHHPPQPPAPPAEEPRRSWTVFGLMIAAQIMVILDVSVVNVALPSISPDLHLSAADYQWTISAY